MKRVIMTALIVCSLLVAASAGTAHAKAKWPAKCKNWKCVNQHLNQLHKAEKADSAVLDVCLLYRVVGVSQYDGYFADDGSGGQTETTALDADPGSSPDVLLLVVNPKCVSNSSAARAQTVMSRVALHQFGMLHQVTDMRVHR